MSLEVLETDAHEILYRPKEVASEISCDLKWFYKCIAAGRVRAVRFGRAVRIPESELLYLKRNGMRPKE